jgi:hypothetical protein
MSIWFTLLVDNLILLNSVQRKKLDIDVVRNLQVCDYLREFGTISLNVGRQVGKSHYIKTHATENDLVIVYNMRNRDYYRDCPATVLSPLQLTPPPGIPPVKYNKIYIDEPALVQRNISLYEVYFITGRDYDQTYILLGHPV